MQALRPGPECRFRAQIRGPQGVPKKKRCVGRIISRASFREHHFENIISRGQAKQSACCMSPLVSSACRILSCRDQALLLSWASSGSSGQKASCFLCTRGSFLMDTGKNNRKYVGVQTCFLPERHTSFCPCQGLSGLSGQRPPPAGQGRASRVRDLPRDVFCSLPGTGRKECAFGKNFFAV